MNKIEQPLTKNDMKGQISMFDNVKDEVKVIENGIPSITEEEEAINNALALLKDQNNFDPTKFLGSFSRNTELALKQILAMQSNDNPLKTGGKGIGFRCDVLILSTRQAFNVNEDFLFDVITGAVSSYPDNDAYTIYTKDCLQFFQSDNIYYLNQVLSEATESLRTKTIDVDVKLPNGKKKKMSIPWYNLLLFTSKSEVDDSSDSSFVSFAPTPLFKLLLVSSTIAHGAHYNIRVSTLFKGYTKTLFFFLESRKNYSKYDGATKGCFDMTIDDLKFLFDLSDNYKERDINDKILKPAKKKFDEAISYGIDFIFDYKVIKGSHNKTIGFSFQITKIVQQDQIEEEREVAKIEDKDLATFQIIQGFGFNEEDAKEILDIYNKEKRDIPYLTAALTKMITNNPDNKKAYICKILKTKVYEDRNKKISSAEKYNQFPQNTYNFEELENEFLSN